MCKRKSVFLTREDESLFHHLLQVIHQWGTTSHWLALWPQPGPRPFRPEMLVAARSPCLNLTTPPHPNFFHGNGPTTLYFHKPSKFYPYQHTFFLKDADSDRRCHSAYDQVIFAHLQTDLATARGLVLKAWCRLAYWQMVHSVNRPLLLSPFRTRKVEGPFKIQFTHLLTKAVSRSRPHHHALKPALPREITGLWIQEHRVKVVNPDLWSFNLPCS